MDSKLIDWKTEETKFLKAVSKVMIPDKKLSYVNHIKLRKEEDFSKIPVKGGCYWIWTNEMVSHSFHRHKTPDKIFNGEIIYNGIAKDNIQWRARNHLLSSEEEGWSGISLDIYKNQSNSHRKKAMSNAKKAKVPYYQTLPIKDKNTLLKIALSNSEIKYIKNSEDVVFYFRNGINIFDKKHRKNEFRIYFIDDLNFLYIDYIEKKWRELYGLPKLCSYSSGR